MKSRINSFFLICLAVLAFVCFARQTAAAVEENAPAGKANEAALPSFPYVAQINADNVNSRSGPGTNYYSCDKLNTADKIEVVGSQFGWSRIVPPAGAFSWISKRYVRLEPNEPNLGTVTGDNVRVYAGSAHIKPIHSTTLQGKLNKDNKVKLLGAEQGDYYKIAPPSFSYLWVSTKYTTPLGPVSEVPMAVEPKADELAAVVQTEISIKDKTLKEYYTLEKQMHIERAKPMDQQDYTDIKKAFVEIAGNKDAGKAARYSQFALGQIKRCELAHAVAKEVRLQDAQLQQIQERIAQAGTARLAEVRDTGKFAAVGQFFTSSIYGSEAELKRYIVIDDDGKIVCYALPEGAALETDLSRFTDRNIGLIGTIEPHPQTAGAIVRFTEIVELK